ncbi:MAG: YggT family protein [Bacteriovoracaceae bacterium]
MIDIFLQIYIYIIIADVVMSYIPSAKSNEIGRTLHKIADFSQKPIRDALPSGMPLDPSPMIVIIICQILMYIF